MVVAFGWNAAGQCNVPPLPTGLNYVEVAAGRDHSLARRSDGSVVAWGDNSNNGQCNVPPLPPGLSYVQIVAGRLSSLARRSDGSAVEWDGQERRAAAPGRTHLCRHPRRESHSVAKRSDGSLIAWGQNYSGQCNIPPLPGGLTVVGIAAGGHHTAALLSDGAVLAWGDNTYGACNVPTLPVGMKFVEIEALEQARLRGTVCPPPPRQSEPAAGGRASGARADPPRIDRSSPSRWFRGHRTRRDSSGAPCRRLLSIGLRVLARGGCRNRRPVVVVAANNAGSWTVSAPLALDPTLVGLQASLQIALFNTQGPFGMDITNGLIATAGY